MMPMTVLGISILLQVAAAIMALRLIWTTGRYIAWSLIAAALVMMAVRRSISFFDLVGDFGGYDAKPISTADLTTELVALVISATMLLGVALIGPVFAALKRAERASREIEVKYRGILDNSIDTFYRTNVDGQIVMASRSASDLLGYSVDELLGRKLADLYADPAGREEFLTALKENDGRIRGYETPLLHKDGHVVTAATSASYVLDDQGKVSGVEGIARNISDRKQTEKLNTRLGRIVEHSANEVYVFDSETLRFLMVNRGARENLGYTMEEMSQMTPVDIKPNFDREDFTRLVAPLRDRSREIVDFETTHQRKDGSTYEVEVRLQLARTEDPPIFFAIIQDVTERRRTEGALLQAQKMEAVGQLTGGVAHDFNNLLAVIMGNTELLQEREGGDDKLLGAVFRAASRGAELTQRLLAFSRQQPLMPETIDLDELVTGMSDLLMRTLCATVEIKTDAAPGLWNAAVDPGQVENALLNLAINARDAMPDGGKLTIECANAVLDEAYVAEHPEATAGDYVVLAVSDTGTGMAPEIKAHVFEPFFTTKEVGQGSGLGLSMVFGFAKQSGGHVTIYSEVGQGTTVKLYLPRAGRDPATEEAGVRDEVARGQGEVVLVIEDDPDVRDTTVNMLGRLGYGVIDVGDASCAHDVLAKGTAVDIVLSDIVLPGGISGPEFAEQAHAAHPALKILFMSGYPTEAAMHNGFLGSGQVLLNKPFKKRDLSRALQDALNTSAPN